MSQGDVAEDGLGKGRMEAFSDGVFAIAITLLVLEIHVPQASNVRPSNLPGHLRALLPQFLSYALSFVIVGVYWVAHHLMMDALRRADRMLLWLNILFLGCITLIPVSADLLGQFRTSPVAVAVYGANLVLASSSLLLWWGYAVHGRRLLAEGIQARYVHTATVRTVSTVALYLCAAALAWVNTSLSLALYWLGPLLYIVLQTRVDADLEAHSRAAEKNLSH